jgi:hypothetical protein
MGARRRKPSVKVLENMPVEGTVVIVPACEWFWHATVQPDPVPVPASAPVSAPVLLQHLLQLLLQLLPSRFPDQ